MPHAASRPYFITRDRWMPLRPVLTTESTDVVTFRVEPHSDSQLLGAVRRARYTAKQVSRFPVPDHDEG